MQDDPSPAEMLATVAAFLRDRVVPSSPPRLAFQARVAASALDLVARQIGEPAEASASERERLAALLGRSVSLADGTAELAERIAAGAVDRDTPGLVDHLWLTTLAKLAVDQPGYSGRLAALEGWAPPKED